MDIKKPLNSQLSEEAPNIPASLRDIFEASFESVSRIDINGSYLSVNQAYADVYGYVTDEMCGLNLIETIDPQDHPLFNNMQKDLHANSRAEGRLRGIRKNGSIFYMHIVLIKGVETKVPVTHYYCFIKDITGETLQQKFELDKALEEFQENGQAYKELLQDINVIIWEVKLPEVKVIFVNDTVVKKLGYSIKNWYDHNLWRERIHPDDRNNVYQSCDQTLALGIDHEIEYRIIAEDGSIIWLHDLVQVVKDKSGTPIKLRSVMIDITEQKKAESELGLVKEKLAIAVNNNPDIILLTRLNDSQILDVNQELINRSGYEAHELIGKKSAELIWANPNERKTYCEQLVEDGQRIIRHINLRKKDGAVFPVASISSLIDIDGEKCVFSVVRDITDMVKAKEEIRNQEQQMRVLADSLPVSVSYLDNELCYQFNNEQFYRDFANVSNIKTGGTIQEFMGGKKFAKIKKYIDVALDGMSVNAEFEYTDGNGEKKIYDVSYIPHKVNGCVHGIYIVSNNITERKKTELALRRVNRAHKVISEFNDVVVRIKDENELLKSACKIIVESGGYRFAWVAYVKNESNEDYIESVTHAGHEDGFLETAKHIWQKQKFRGHVTQAARTGKASVVRNIYTDQSYSPLRDEASKRGYASSVSLPLKVTGLCIGVLSIYAPDTDAFDKEELALLERLAMHLSYGIQAIRTRVLQKKSEDIVELENYTFKLLYSISSLDDLLVKLVHKIESLLTDTYCSIHLLDEAGECFSHVTAPSLGNDYKNIIQSVNINGNAGPCGTAVYRNESVLAGDISTDKFWQDYGDFALEYGITACQSSPIRNTDGKVLGTLAHYYRVSGTLENESHLVERLANVIGNSIERRMTNEMVKANQERFQLLSLATHDGIYDWDLKMNKVWKNEAYHRIFGIKEPLDEDEHLYGKNVHPEDRDPLIQNLKNKFRDKSNQWEEQYRFLRSDGTYADVLDRGYIIYDHNKDAERMIGAITDISQHKQAQLQIQESEERFRTLYDDSPTMILTLYPDGTIVSINKFGAGHLGYSVDELTGKSILDICAPQDKKVIADKLIECIANPGTIYRCEIREMHNFGEVIWVRATLRLIRYTQEDVKILITCEDISETRMLSEQLEYQAQHDSLTGLINRGEFEKRLRRVLNSKLNASDNAICYLDLDQFKVINDTCGHLAGDELIRQVSELFTSIVRKRDTLARLGGDEFAVLMEHCTIEQATRVAENLLQAVRNYQFTWENNRFNLGVSIGLVPINADSGSVNDVLSVADTACYAAKDSGRNRMYVYQSGDIELSARQGEMRWVAGINEALEDNRLCLARQTISPLGDRKNTEVGNYYELLLRMRDDNGKIISPGHFLPAAERYNLSIKLDEWVINTAIDWLTNQAQELESLKLCTINLSGHSLGDREFLDLLLDKFERSKVPPDKICFEITETAAVSNFDNARRFMQELKSIGCSFALDDFGAGLSSFNYLKNLPVDFLKIDGSFVREIDKNPVDLAMVKSINEIGKVMGKTTIAEFVENHAILQMLEDMGVDYAQGYAIAAPQLLDM